MADPSDDPARAPRAVPRGEVTFLFTDIVGSTGLWESQGHLMPAAYVRHDAILRGAIEAHGGRVYKTIGDAFQAAFPDAAAAVAATLRAQRGFAAEAWDLPAPLRIRTVLHVGEVEPQPDGDYRSPHLNRLGRLLGVGNGGQILLSSAVAERAEGALPPGADLRDLGERRLKDLAQADRLFQLLHPELPDDFPPLKTLDYRPHNLPVQLTPFVGREGDIAAVRERLERSGLRLLTLSGPGGIGKTRLSLQVAAEVLERFADGVFFVALDAVTDPALVASAIAEALGVRETGEQPLPEALRDHLRERELLLVLDNFEQVVEAAPLLADLLRDCRRLHLLVSSRQVLRLHGEHEYAVPPLGLPPRGRRARPAPEELERYEAVRLFVERAVAAKADFRVTAANAADVAAICAALDGLPLALELAAARVKLLPPAALLARLEKRLALLTGGGRDRTARQQTLRGAIAWSHDLLPPAERTLFRRLAVFAGGCSLEAVEAVVAGGGAAPDPLDGFDPLDGVASLVDKSLVRQEETTEGEPRFALLATIREYAAERLEEAGELAAVQRAHAAAFLELAERAAPALTGPQQATWLHRLETEHDNLRAALAWTEEAGGGEDGLRLAGALWRFWWVRGHFGEGRGWLERALDRGDGRPSRARAGALFGAGVMAHHQGELVWASGLYEQARALSESLGDRTGVARALGTLGSVALDQGAYERAEHRYEEALALNRADGDERGISINSSQLGALAFTRGQYERATSFFEENLTLSRRLGDHQMVAYALFNLAEARHHRGDLDRAAALYQEVLPLFDELGDVGGRADALSCLGRVALARGEVTRAGALLGEGMQLFREAGDRVGMAGSLEWLAAVAGAGDDPIRAARLFGAAEALREAIEAPLGPAYQADYDRNVDAVQTALGWPIFAAAWDEGRTLPLEEALVEAGGVVDGGR